MHDSIRLQFIASIIFSLVWIVALISFWLCRKKPPILHRFYFLTLFASLWYIIYFINMSVIAFLYDPEKSLDSAYACSIFSLFIFSLSRFIQGPIFLVSLLTLIYQKSVHRYKLLYAREQQKQLNVEIECDFKRSDNLQLNLHHDHQPSDDSKDNNNLGDEHKDKERSDFIDNRNRNNDHNRMSINNIHDLQHNVNRNTDNNNQIESSDKQIPNDDLVIEDFDLRIFSSQNFDRSMANNHDHTNLPTMTNSQLDKPKSEGNILAAKILHDNDKSQKFEAATHRIDSKESQLDEISDAESSHSTSKRGNPLDYLGNFFLTNQKYFKSQYLYIVLGILLVCHVATTLIVFYTSPMSSRSAKIEADPNVSFSNTSSCTPTLMTHLNTLFFLFYICFIIPCLFLLFYAKDGYYQSQEGVVYGLLYCVNAILFVNMEAKWFHFSIVGLGAYPFLFLYIVPLLLMPLARVLQHEIRSRRQSSRREYLSRSGTLNNPCNNSKNIAITNNTNLNLVDTEQTGKPLDKTLVAAAAHNSTPVLSNLQKSNGSSGVIPPQGKQHRSQNRVFFKKRTKKSKSAKISESQELHCWKEFVSNLNIDQVFADHKLLHALRTYTTECWCTENLLCYEAILEYEKKFKKKDLHSGFDATNSTITSTQAFNGSVPCVCETQNGSNHNNVFYRCVHHSAVRKQFDFILKTYIRNDAPLCVNIDDKSRERMTVFHQQMLDNAFGPHRMNSKISSQRNSSRTSSLLSSAVSTMANSIRSRSNNLFPPEEDVAIVSFNADVKPKTFYDNVVPGTSSNRNSELQNTLSSSVVLAETENVKQNRVLGEASEPLPVSSDCSQPKFTVRSDKPFETLSKYVFEDVKQQVRAHLSFTLHYGLVNSNHLKKIYHERRDEYYELLKFGQ